MSSDMLVKGCVKTAVVKINSIIGEMIGELAKPEPDKKEVLIMVKQLHLYNMELWKICGNRKELSILK